MPKGKNVEMKEKIKVSHHLRSYIKANMLNTLDTDIKGEIEIILPTLLFFFVKASVESKSGKWQL